jgi:hypothetical protein
MPDISAELIAQRQKAFRDNPKFLASVRREITHGLLPVIADRYHVFCLGPDCGNLLMWTHYAENPKGICLEFSPPNAVMCCGQQVESSVVPRLGALQ